MTHRSRNTWNGDGGGGGGGGSIHPQVFHKNGFLINCLLFGNTNFFFYYKKTLWLKLNISLHKTKKL